MKLLIISALLLVIFVSCSTAQWQRCHGQQWVPTCWGQGHRGRGGGGCRKQNVWYYDRSSGQCRPLHYWGCGGNSNRWCSQAGCLRACRRSG